MISARTKKLTIIAVLAALAYVIVAFARVPVIAVPPLKYDPKDAIIVIGGFLFGPLAAFSISLVVSFFEMITVSETGWIGALMNLISTCAFACTASAIYKYIRTLKGAVIGLVCGLITMVAVMLLWNYLLTPIFLGYPREAVTAMLIPVFLPFNLLKGSLNLALTILLYKPIRAGLSAANLLPDVKEGEKTKINTAMMLIAVFIVITGILVILAYREII